MQQEECHKVCSNCRASQPVTNFYKRADDARWLRSHCKKCCRKKDQEYTEKNRPAVRRKGQLYRQKNIIQTMLHVARNRAKKKGWEYNLLATDLMLPEYCPVLGLKLEAQINKAADNSPSLDRIDSKKGYIKGNVQIISRRANILKNNATLQEIEALYKFMRGSP